MDRLEHRARGQRQDGQGPAGRAVPPADADGRPVRRARLRRDAVGRARALRGAPLAAAAGGGDAARVRRGAQRVHAPPAEAGLPRRPQGDGVHALPPPTRPCQPEPCQPDRPPPPSASPLHAPSPTRAGRGGGRRRLPRRGLPAARLHRLRARVPEAQGAAPHGRPRAGVVACRADARARARAPRAARGARAAQGDHDAAVRGDARLRAGREGPARAGAAAAAGDARRRQGRVRGARAPARLVAARVGAGGRSQGPVVLRHAGGAAARGGGRGGAHRRARDDGAVGHLGDAGRPALGDVQGHHAAARRLPDQHERGAPVAPTSQA